MRSPGSGSPLKSEKCVLARPSLRAVAFIWPRKSGQAAAFTVGGGEGVGGVAAGRQQQPVQQLQRGQLLPRREARGGGVVLLVVADDAARHRDDPVQIAGLDDHVGGHDLGDRAHRVLADRPPGPEVGAGGLVGQFGPRRPHGRRLRARRSLLAVTIARVPREVAARAAGATATINPATNPAATVDVASRPVIRISFPSACTNAIQRILPVRPVCGGRLRLNFLRTGTRPRPECGRPTSPFG